MLLSSLHHVTLVFSLVSLPLVTSHLHCILHSAINVSFLRHRSDLGNLPPIVHNNPQTPRRNPKVLISALIERYCVFLWRELLGIKKHFTEEVTFHQGFEGWIKALQVEKGTIIVQAKGMVCTEHRKENPETNPCIECPLNTNRGAKNVPWGKDSLQ